MTGVDALVDGSRAAHARLLATVDAVTDEQARRPSRLPEWTVGHVLTHLARNADSHTRMLEAAARGDAVDQYAGGDEQRARDIQAGAGRPADGLAADVREATARLEETWAKTPADVWANGKGRMGGVETPVSELPFLRWREVEIHHADLGLGFSWADWSDAYVDLEMKRTVAGLAPRLPPGMALRLEPTDDGRAWSVPHESTGVVVVSRPRRELLAWLVGRLDAGDAAGDTGLPGIGAWQREHRIIPDQGGRAGA